MKARFNNLGNNQNKFEKQENIAVLEFVELFFIQLQEILDDWYSSNIEQMLDQHQPERYTEGLFDEVLAYDILANWASLRRFRIDLLERQDHDIIQNFKQIVHNYGQLLAEAALFVPDVKAWIQEAKLFKQFYDDNNIGNFEMRSILTRQLISDLDDATLVCYATDFFGKYNEKFEKNIVEAELWINHNPQVFITSAKYIRTILKTFRGDLWENDPALALTANKFSLINEEINSAEKVLNFESNLICDFDVAREIIIQYFPEKSFHFFIKNFIEKTNTVINGVRNRFQKRLNGLRNTVGMLACLQTYYLQAEDDSWRFKVEVNQKDMEKQKIVFVFQPIHTNQDVKKLKIDSLEREFVKNESTGFINTYITIEEIQNILKHTDNPQIAALLSDGNWHTAKESQDEDFEIDDSNCAHD